MKKQGKLHFILIVTLSAAVVLIAAFFIIPAQSYKSDSAVQQVNSNTSTQTGEQALASSPTNGIATPTVIQATHIPIPDAVKAIYITKWVAGSTKARTRIEGILDTTEANAVVIDIKDYSGKISFRVSDPTLMAENSAENDIPNIRAIINELHAKNVYVIGRVSTFQDPYMTARHPDWAIEKKSDGTVWKDRKGLSFLDPANKHVWDYLVALAEESHNDGFDEINFDYIRYPSDGDIKNIDYKLTTDANGVKTTRADTLENFFKYLSSTLKTDAPDLKISADFFGLVTTETTNDLGIGQVLEKGLLYFDFIAPMVYPSHFAPDTYGYKDPASKPYEIISYSMKKAVERTKAMGLDPNKLRPWLQDFNLGAKYTTDMVKLEIKAVQDSGLSSWMMWDPNNIYHSDAFAKE